MTTRRRREAKRRRLTIARSTRATRSGPVPPARAADVLPPLARRIRTAEASADPRPAEDLAAAQPATLTLHRVRAALDTLS